MSRLTPTQRKALDAVCHARAPGLSAGALAAELKTSREGAAQTASSLVRRQLVARSVQYSAIAGRKRSRITFYVATTAGHEQAAAVRKQLALVR